MAVPFFRRPPLAPAGPPGPHVLQGAWFAVLVIGLTVAWLVWQVAGGGGVLEIGVGVLVLALNTWCVLYIRRADPDTLRRRARRPY